MSKILCFDIDGTLIGEDGRFPESAQYALKQAAKEGHTLVLCTGRNRPTIQKKILEFGFNGIISSAGASVTYGERKVFQKRIDAGYLKLFCDYCSQNGIAFLVQGGDFNSTDTYSSKVLSDHYYKHEVYISVGERFLNEHKVFQSADEVTDAEKLIYYFSTKTIKKIQKEISDYYFIVPFGNKNADLSCGEVLQRGITKAYGIQRLIDYLGKAREDIYAFGDGPNDIEMLRFAGVGVAMKNGSECAFEAADMIADAVEEDGIWKAMKTLGLIRG